MSVPTETERREAQAGSVEGAAEPALASQHSHESLWGRLWRFRWVLLMVCLVAGVAGAAFALLRDDTYTVTASVFLEPEPFEVAPIAGQADSERHIATQAGIIQSGVVLSTATRRPGARDLSLYREAVSAQPQVDRNEVVVSVTAESPQAAAGMLESVVSVYRELIATEVRRQVELVSRTGEVGSPDDELLRARAAAYGDGVRFLEAQPQLSADGPRPVTLAALAAISALFLGAAVLAAPAIK